MKTAEQYAREFIVGPETLNGCDNEPQCECDRCTAEHALMELTAVMAAAQTEAHAAGREAALNEAIEVLALMSCMCGHTIRALKTKPEEGE